MNTKTLLTVLAGSALLYLSPQANAQTTAPTLFQLVISGVCWTTNSSGRIVPQCLNNRTLLQQVAAIDGVSDFSGWALAYHVGGSDMGDTIDIINRTNGAVLQNLFGLYFGESFGRESLLSGSGRQLKRIEYVYTGQNSHSLGSVLLTDYFFFDANGNTNNIVILGQMQYLVVPDSTHPNLQVCSANFATIRPWTFSPP